MNWFSCKICSKKEGKGKRNGHMYTTNVYYEMNLLLLNVCVCKLNVIYNIYFNAGILVIGT